MPTVSVIIVTHNDSGIVHRAIASLKGQTLPPRQIILVDSGSKDPSFLCRYHGDEGVDRVLSPTNIGFTGGNNLGYLCLEPETEYVLFMNPDLCLSQDYLEKAAALMDKHRDWGALTGLLLGYDFNKDCPTGKYDSAGIGRTWYGRWYDRAQGEPVDPMRFGAHEEVPAICGAAQFCRRSALGQVETANHEVYDPGFFMYKEDIDLSIRLRKAGWKLLLCPEIIAYHGRGWNRDRSRVRRQFRLMSAKNELKVQYRIRSWTGMGYSLAKYLAVYCLNV
jgi:GT2 family glycosyltransferase